MDPANDSAPRARPAALARRRHPPTARPHLRLVRPRWPAPALDRLLARLACASPRGAGGGAARAESFAALLVEYREAVRAARRLAADAGGAGGTQ